MNNITTKRKKEQGIPRIKKQREIDAALGKIVKVSIPYGVNKQSFDGLKFTNEQDKKTFELALTTLAQPLRGLFRLHTVYDEMVVLFRMAQAYPWNKRAISRSQHLHLVWLLFVNLCYSFEEKFKLAANAHNRALKAFGVAGGIDVKNGIKRIGENLKEHIRKRGEQIHQWRRTHDARDNCSVTERAT